MKRLVFAIAIVIGILVGFVGCGRSNDQVELVLIGDVNVKGDEWSLVRDELIGRLAERGIVISNNSKLTVECELAWRREFANSSLRLNCHLIDKSRGLSMGASATEVNKEWARVAQPTDSGMAQKVTIRVANLFRRQLNAQRVFKRPSSNQ